MILGYTLILSTLADGSVSRTEDTFDYWVTYDEGLGISDDVFSLYVFMVSAFDFLPPRFDNDPELLEPTESTVLASS